MHAEEGLPAPTGRTLRASDSERDAVAEHLNAALAEGRLDTEEHSERLDSVYAAKTRAELAPLTADLPTEPRRDADAPVQGMERVVDAEPTSRNAWTIMGAAIREGVWVVPERFTAGSVMGHAQIDLREARFTAKHTTIQAHSLMGSVEVVVPDDVELRVEGLGVMGAYWVEGEVPERNVSNAPVVTVTGVALMGAAWGTYKAREHQKPPKKKRWWHRTKAVEE